MIDDMIAKTDAAIDYLAPRAEGTEGCLTDLAREHLARSLGRVKVAKGALIVARRYREAGNEADALVALGCAARYLDTARHFNNLGVVEAAHVAVIRHLESIEFGS